MVVPFLRDVDVSLLSVVAEQIPRDLGCPRKILWCLIAREHLLCLYIDAVFLF